MYYKKKYTIYLNLDQTLVDFHSAINRLDIETRNKYVSNLDKVPGIFAFMDPQPGVVEAYKQLSQYYRVYIICTDPWENVGTWTSKVDWVRQHLGENACHHIIFTQDFCVLKGHYLIDTRKPLGFVSFEGVYLQLGSGLYPDWESITAYLMQFPQPVKYGNVKEILTLNLPKDDDSFLKGIKDKEHYDAEADEIYQRVIKKKVAEVTSGTFKGLYTPNFYNPDADDTFDTLSFTFAVGAINIVIKVTNLTFLPCGTFERVLAFIDCQISSEDANTVIPDYIEKLMFNAPCEIECLDNALNVLFYEISRNKERYEKENK